MRRLSRIALTGPLMVSFANSFTTLPVALDTALSPETSSKEAAQGTTLRRCPNSCSDASISCSGASISPSAIAQRRRYRWRRDAAQSGLHRTCGERPYRPSCLILNAGDSDNDSAQTGDNERAHEAASNGSIMNTGPRPEQIPTARANGGGVPRAEKRGNRNAARAAVAVVESIQESERAEGGVPWGRARTTRAVMVEACLRANMTESRAERATDIFVVALAGAALAGEAEQESLVQDLVVQALLEEPDWFTAANGTGMGIGRGRTDGQRAGWGAATSADGARDRRHANGSGVEGSDGHNPFSEEPLARLAARNSQVADEVKAMLDSKPRSTAFSRLTVEAFEDWVKASFLEPVSVSSALAAGLNLYQDPAVILSTVIRGAFEEAAGVLAGALLMADGDEVKFLTRQRGVDAAGMSALMQLGDPSGNLTVSDELVDRFIDEVFPGLLTASECVTSTCGVRLIRCRAVDKGMSAAEVSLRARARLAESGLNDKLMAFLTNDGIGGFNEFMDITSKIRKVDIESQGAEEIIGPGFEVLLGRADKRSAQYLFAVVPPQNFGMDHDFFPTTLSGFFREGFRNCIRDELANIRPAQKSLMGEDAVTLLSATAPIVLYLFAADAYGIGAAEGGADLTPFLKAGMLGLIMAGLATFREFARSFFAAKGGMRLAFPRPLPSPQTGLLAPNTLLTSYPKNAQDLFDLVIGGPAAGLLASAAALLIGLQMTVSAGSEALAGFPSLPSSLLQGSLLVGSVVDFFLHTNLAAQDIASPRIAMHPLAVAGVASMLWNSAVVLPIMGSDGKTALDTVDIDSTLAGAFSFAAFVFAAVQVFGPNGDFLLAVLAASTFAYPQSDPIIRQDNVTRVTDPLRLLLALLVAVVSISALSPMTLTSFLAPGITSVDTGAGAESVAAGLGVGGVGLRGIL